MKALTLLFLGLVLATAVRAELLRPSVLPTEEGILLAEQVWACQIGYGLENDQLQPQGQLVLDPNTPNPHSPGQNPGRPGYLGMGCLMAGAYFDYSFVDKTLALPPGFEAFGKPWDALSYRLDLISMGASISLLAHWTYLDLGLTGYNLSYQLGYFPADPVQNGTSEILKQTGQLVHLRLRQSLGAHLFASYESYRNPDSTDFVRSVSKGGINLMIRF